MWRRAGASRRRVTLNGMHTIEQPRLSDAQRDKLMAALDRDGYFMLPVKLPDPMLRDAIAAIDALALKQLEAADGAGASSRPTSVKMHNCVDLSPAFRALMMFEPALQLAYDAFGPMFHLNQSNFVYRGRDSGAGDDFVNASGWHADGPRPGLFPRVNGAMGLHYLKFGYFLNDIPAEGGSPLRVVRGSHKRDERDGRPLATFDISDYADDLVELRVAAGTVVAFHQAQWHAAAPNTSDVVRKNVYISYCPTWMRPVDRADPPREALAGLSAEERWLLGEPRDQPLRWWLPNGDDLQRMARFARDGE